MVKGKACTIYNLNRTLVGVVLGFILFATCLSAKAQLFDSIRYDLKMKPVFHYKLDSRSAFIGNKSANVWGIKFGVGFNRKIRFGLGYNYLKSRSPSAYSPYDSRINSFTKSRLQMRYMSIYVEYIYYRKNKWELSVPVQLGIGSTRYVPYLDSKLSIKTPARLVILYEPCLSVNYRIVPFAAVGTEMGLRLALHKNNEIKEQLTAPIYVFKVIIYWSDMINYFWPNNKVPKVIMDII